MKSTVVDVPNLPVFPSIDDHVSVVSEIKFPALVKQGKISEDYDIVVDTGAGCGYLIWPSSSPCTWTTERCSMRVKVADGSTVEITQKVNCSMSVADRFFEVCLYVLPATVEVPYVLCGRALIELFDLIIQGCSRVVTRDGVCLFGESDGVRISSSVPCESPSVTPLSPRSFRPLSSSSEDSCPLSPPHAVEDRSLPSPAGDPCVVSSLPVVEKHSVAEVVSDSRHATLTLETTSVCNLPSFATDTDVSREADVSTTALYVTSPVTLAPVSRSAATVPLSSALPAGDPAEMSDFAVTPLPVPLEDVASCALPVSAEMSDFAAPSLPVTLEDVSSCALPVSVEVSDFAAPSLPVSHEDHVFSCALPVDSHCVSSIIRPAEVPDSVVLSPHDGALPAIDNVLNELCSQGRVPLLYCPSGYLRLRAIDPGGSKDLPDQTHQFVLELPDQKPRTSSGGYSAALYRRLKEDQRLHFDSLVKEYVDTGWWEPLSPDDSRAIHATDVFMHKPGTAKARLVCDFRKYNSLFRDVSSVTPLLDHLLLLLRTEPVDNVCVGDCSKAFYRVRLDPPLPLRAGLNTYLCSRVSFGLSMGPEALRSSLGRLFDLWCRKVAKGDGFLPLFVDDFVFMHSGSSDIFSHDVSSFVTLLRRCGFAISKTKWQQSFPLTLFNRRLERVDDVVKTCCPDRSQRSASLLHSLRDSPTKRRAFELAGVLGYDPVKLHPYHRLTADVLRQICGREKTWDGPFKPSTPLSLLLEWIGQLDCGPCVHSFAQSSLSNIEITTDASIYGYGYLVSFNKQTVLEQAGSWSGSEFSYHTNRLEGIALLRGMRAVANYLEFRQSVRFGCPVLKPSITVRTDSKSAVAWALGRPPTNASHSLEFRMLTRLSTALTGEAEVLSGLSAQFELSHAPGVSNAADALSRSLYKNNIGSLLRTKIGVPDEVHTISTDLLIENFANDSFDIDDFLDRFELYLKVFDSFRPVVSLQQEPLLDRIARSAQVTLDSRRKNLYVLKNGMYFHEWVDLNGHLQSKPVIPHEYSRFRELMLRAFHRMNGHRGAQFDLSFLFERSPFFFEKALTACKITVRRCLICAVRKARSAQVCPANVVTRQFDLPPYSRIACDLLYVTRNEPIFSSMCIDTGVVSFIPVKNAKMDSLLAALRTVSYRYCVSFKRILWDNAPAFVSERMHQRLRLEGHPDVEFFFTPTDGSTMNPVERMHRECWSILRSRGFVKNLKKGEWRNCLEEVACIINQRPIGHHGESVITPARLAFGSAHGPTGDQIYAVRKYFYEQIFLTRRRRHTPRQRRALLTLGSFVLLHCSSPSKLGMPFKIGRIIDLAPGHLVVKSGQTISRVATANVAPLDAFFQADNSPGDRVVEN